MTKLVDNMLLPMYKHNNIDIYSCSIVKNETFNVQQSIYTIYGFGLYTS